MTHDELLKKILKTGILGRELGKNEWVYDEKTKALRAVVELHKPEPLDERGDVCLTCCPDLLTLYPCPTIQTIQEQLK